MPPGPPHHVHLRALVLLDGSTRPVPQLVAVARIGAVALDVHVRPWVAVAVPDEVRCEVAHHVLVGSTAARCQAHAVFSVDLLVLAGIGVARVHAHHATFIVLDERFGEMAEIRFGARAGIEALLEIVVEHGLMVGEVQAFGESGLRLALPVDGRIAHAADAVGNVRAGIHRHLVILEDLAIRALDPPVHSLRVAQDELADDIVIRDAGALLELFLDDGLKVEVGQAEGVGQLAVQVAVLAGALLRHGTLLDADDLGAALGRRTERRDARDAQTHDRHVAVKLFLHHIVGDLRRIGGPRIIVSPRRRGKSFGGVGRARSRRSIARRACRRRLRRTSRQRCSRSQRRHAS